MFRHSPYQGLTPFDEGDADYFFGRTKEARLIEADLFAASLTLLYGASGVGKSSVLRAGLLPRLRRRDDLVPVIFNSWQIDPARGLKDAVLAALAAIGGAELPSKDRGQQLLPLAEFLDSCAERSGRRLMIVLDQFEEYAFYHPEDDTFGREFPPATCLGNLSVSFIVSLREDSLATLDRFEGRIPTLFDSYRRIEHLSHAAAREAIIKPLLKFADDMGAEAGPTDTEATLVEAVIDEVQTGKVTVGESGSDILTPISSGRIEAPYLQPVMTRLWNRELELNSPLIRWETLASLGHARRIVQTHLDTVMDQLSPEDQDVAARVFHLLVTPSGTKIAHSVKDLAVYAGVDRDRLRHVLNTLSSGQDRILRTTAALPEQPGEPRYEIFHDRLGSAVLDWRARYLQEYEAKEARRAEFGQSQLARALVELRMQSLSPAHRDTFASAVPHLVTHTGTRSSLTASDLAERTTVQRKDIEIVLRQLTQGTPPLILVVDERRAGPHHYQIADDVFGPALLTWAKQLAHSRKSERTKATDWTSKRYQRRIRRGQSRPPYAIIEDVAMEGDLTIVLGLGASILDGPRSAKQFEAGISDSPPLGVELATSLAREVGYPDPETSFDLHKVASFYSMMRDQLALITRLNKFFSREFQPNELHLFIARVAQEKPLTIITTTFDLMLQTAFDKCDVPYELFANWYDRREPCLLHKHGETVKLLDNRHILPRRKDTSTIYKLYGSAPFSELGGSYIVTEEDQMALLVELGAGRLVPEHIRVDLARKHKLFLGTSLRGWVERWFFGRLGTHPMFRTSAWAICRSPSPLDVIRWERLGVELYDMELRDFLENLISVS